MNFAHGKTSLYQKIKILSQKNCRNCKQRELKTHFPVFLANGQIAVPLKNNQLLLPDKISGSLFSFEQPERSSLVRNSKLNIPDERLLWLLLPLRFKRDLEFYASLFKRGMNVGFGVLAISLLQAAWIV